MKILVACEESGEVRKSLRRRFHNAWSCDLLPADDGDPHHIQDDIFSVLWADPAWDAMLAFWPCTRLCNSGVRWLEERNLWEDMRKSARCFRKLLNFTPIPKRALENPIPHKYAVREIGCKYDQIIQPWQFGRGETKATCLWIRNLPLLRPTQIVSGRYPRLHRLSPSPDRAKLRSRTYTGIAEAMADQWFGTNKKRIMLCKT